MVWFRQLRLVVLVALAISPMFSQGLVMCTTVDGDRRIDFEHVADRAEHTHGDTAHQHASAEHPGHAVAELSPCAHGCVDERAPVPTPTTAAGTDLVGPAHTFVRFDYGVERAAPPVTRAISIGARTPPIVRTTVLLT